MSVSRDEMRRALERVSGAQIEEAEFLKVYDEYLKTGTGWSRNGKHMSSHEVYMTSDSGVQIAGSDRIFWSIDSHPADPTVFRTPVQQAIKEMLK